MDERVLKEIVREIIGTEQTLDDCAVFSFGGMFLVATTDMLHETTDFPGGMTDWQVGWMSVAVTLSDIAAMGAQPSIVLLAIGLDNGDRLREILCGAKACCDSFGAELSGGDLDAHQELTIVSSGIGIVEEGAVIRRRGAVPGDLICITGPLGRAQAALEGYSRYTQNLLEPIPRVAEGKRLATAGVSSMMDISDGLVLSLYDLLDANPYGYSIDSFLLPIPEGIPPEKSREYALFGGGDFELLFTCSPDYYPVSGVDSIIVGEVIKEHEVLVDRTVAPCRGYQHRWK
ncbi:MAG TPA: thiamine-phosphate kinase [Methanoregulaceae archaeon]|nr:thiamine-phosphate kinase [Methanoregulaceae archaeon]